MGVGGTSGATLLRGRARYRYRVPRRVGALDWRCGVGRVRIAAVAVESSEWGSAIGGTAFPGRWIGLVVVVVVVAVAVAVVAVVVVAVVAVVVAGCCFGGQTKGSADEKGEMAKFKL